MNLRELRSVLTDSDPSDWSKIDNDGPFYRNGFVVSGRGDDGQVTGVYWHHSSAVYREDVDLTIQWGMDPDPTMGRDDWSFPWAEKSTFRKTRPYLFDVFWRGVLVDRYVLISLDGSDRVPHPTPSGEADWYVTKRQAAIARLVEGLEVHKFGVDTCMSLFDFKVEPDED